MADGFIKMYFGDDFDGYVSTKEIMYLIIEFIENDISSGVDAHFLVMAYHGDPTCGDYVVSPRMNYRQEAEIWLDQIIKQIKEF